MAKLNKNKSIISVYAEVIKHMGRNAIDTIIIESNKLMVILQICIPIIIASTTSNVWLSLTLSTLIVLIIHIVKNVRTEIMLETKSGVPILDKEYVKKDKDGFLLIEDMAEYTDLLQYTYSLQQYFKSKGMIE